MFELAANLLAYSTKEQDTRAAELNQRQKSDAVEMATLRKAAKMQEGDINMLEEKGEKIFVESPYKKK